MDIMKKSHGRQVMHISGVLEARNERSQQGCIFCAVGLSIPGTRGVEPTGAGPTGSQGAAPERGEEGNRGGGEVLSGAPPSQVTQSSPKLLPVVTTRLQSVFSVSDMDSNAQQVPVAEKAAPQPTEEAPAVEQSPAPAAEPVAKVEEAPAAEETTV